MPRGAAAPEDSGGATWLTTGGSDMLAQSVWPTSPLLPCLAEGDVYQFGEGRCPCRMMGV